MANTDTNAIQTAVNSYLDGIVARERKFYADSAQPNKFDRVTGEFESAAPHEPLSSIFGFVPVFLPDLSVEIYVRFGGPEIIRKMYGAGYGIDPEKDAAYGKYTKIGSPRDNVGYRFGTEYNNLRGDSAYNTLYSTSDAYERDLIQRAAIGMIPDSVSDFAPNLSDIRQIYKFKLVPKAGKFELQYSHRGADYAPLKKDASAYASFGTDLILDAIDTVLISVESDARQLIESAKTKAGQTAAIHEFLIRLAVSFEAAALDGVSYGSYTYAPGVDHELDQVWWAALSQLLPAGSGDWAGEDLLVGVANKCVEGIASTQPVTPACRAALSTQMSSILTGYALAGVDGDAIRQREAALRGQIANLEGEAEGLREQIQTLESGAAGSSSLYTYAGVVAGAGAAYLSVKDRDLETWHMAAAVVAGGVLGAIPVVNFATIALTPLIAEHTVKALQSRQNPIRVPAPYVGSEDD